MKTPAILALLLVSLGSCARAPARPTTGDYPMDLQLSRLGGGEIRLAAQGGQVVVVNFFATWCLPCLAEIPYFNRLHTEVPGVRVFGVSMDAGGVRVLRPFVERFDVQYPVMLADDDVFEGRTAFGPVPGIPATFLIDQEGRPVTAVMGLVDQPTFTELVREVVEGRRRGRTP